jgi:hypothetical protein
MSEMGDATTKRPLRKRSEAKRAASPAVEDLSRKLSNALADSSARDAAAAAGVERPEAPPLFEHANRARLAEGFQQIVETIFVALPDVKREYDRLVAQLRVGERRSDNATLREALDDAEDNARRAHALYLTARTEQERFELDAEPAGAAMWEKATRVLQQEKDQGLRSKQITDADVRAMAATLFPDEWRSHNLRLAEVKKMVEGCQHLAELWKRRCSSLETLLQTLRRG